MDAIAVLGIVGGIALLVSFYGGGDVDRVRIPPLPSRVRLASGILGAFLLGFVMWISYRQSAQPVLPTTNAVETADPGSTSTVAMESTPTDADTPAKCGALELTFITPGALLEDNIRLYKLIGKGFCSDTLVSVSGEAFVGNNPAIPANSQPAEVASDGTWLTVYIMPSPSSNDGETIKVRNPDGSIATLFAPFQR